MNVIIATSSNITLAQVSSAMLKSDMLPDEVFVGGDVGTTAPGEQWAKAQHIARRWFPAWPGAHGARAESVRAQAMVDEAQALVVVGESEELTDLISLAIANELLVKVYRPKGAA